MGHRQRRRRHWRCRTPQHLKIGVRTDHRVRRRSLIQWREAKEEDTQANLPGRWDTAVVQLRTFYNSGRSDALTWLQNRRRRPMGLLSVKMDNGTTDSYHVATRSIGIEKLAPIDKTTYVKFVVPPWEVAFFSKPTYRVGRPVGITKYPMHPTTCLMNTRASPNWVDEVCIHLQWRWHFQQLPTLNLHTVTKQAITVVGVIPLIAQMEHLQVWTWFGVVGTLTVDVLLGTKFIEWCVRAINPTVRKIVPLYSWSVSILPAAKLSQQSANNL